MRIPRLLKLTLLTWVVVYAALVIGVWFGQRSLIYIPDRDVPAASALGVHGVEDIEFQAADGTRLHGWLARPATATANGAAALLFHGNAGNVLSHVEGLIALSRAGYIALLFDWRGFGRSAGSPTEEGLYSDARGALAALLAQPGVDPARVIYVGSSLGSGPAVQLATERPPAALVLVTPFPSLGDVAAAHFPWLPARALLSDRYDNMAKIGAVRAPIAVIAAAEDEVIPIAQARRLFDAAPEPKFWYAIEGATHNSCLTTDRKGYLATVAKALAAAR